MNQAEYCHQWRLRNPEKAKEYSRQRYLKAGEEIKRYAREYYWTHVEEIKEKHRQWRLANPEEERAKNLRANEKRKWKNIQAHQMLKQVVLTYYGHGRLACVMCGFEDLRALSIDHINGCGVKHRKEIGLQRGCDFYRWLKAEDYPEGYQTLCMNCQFIKRETNKELVRNNA